MKGRGNRAGGGYIIWSVYLHVWQILEHESLVEFWIEILPMNFCFVFRLFVREEIKLDEWIREPGGPVGWREVAALNYLHRGKVLIKIITRNLLLQQCQCLRRTKDLRNLLDAQQITSPGVGGSLPKSIRRSSLTHRHF